MGLPKKIQNAYVIWSKHHGKWWRPDAAGYTSAFLFAGIYTEEDARRKATRDGAGITPLLTAMQANLPRDSWDAHVQSNPGATVAGVLMNPYDGPPRISGMPRVGWYAGSPAEDPDFSPDNPDDPRAIASLIGAPGKLDELVDPDWLTGGKDS